MKPVRVLMMSACVMVLGVPAMAQQLYVSPSSQNYYATDTTVPIYNNSGKPLAMDQLIAGKNAPSYNYNSGNNIRPYNLGGTGTTTSGAGAPLSPSEVAQMRANRDAQAQRYEQQYLQQAQQSQAVTAPEGYAAAAYNSVYGGQQQRPTKKRLLYKKDENLMPIPPRLFNPDQ